MSSGKLNSLLRRAFNSQSFHHFLDAFPFTTASSPIPTSTPPTSTVTAPSSVDKASAATESLPEVNMTQVKSDKMDLEPHSTDSDIQIVEESSMSPVSKKRKLQGKLAQESKIEIGEDQFTASVQYTRIFICSKPLQ